MMLYDGMILYWYPVLVSGMRHAVITCHTCGHLTYHLSYKLRRENQKYIFPLSVAQLVSNELE